MKFKDAIKEILKTKGGALTPQEIREFIKSDYPEYYKTEAHIRNVQKGHYQHEEHALLANIYTSVSKDSNFSIDRSTKPFKVSLASDITQAQKTQSNFDLIIELFNQYKESPNEQWLKEYTERIEQVESLKSKPATEISVDILRQLWMQKANGISNVGLGFMYESEFEAVLDQLPDITLKIINSPTSTTLNEIEVWANQQKKSGKLKRVLWAVIFRVFAAANPDQLSTIVNQGSLDQLIKVLNNEHGFDVLKKGNWFDKNKSLMEALKQHGLEHEDLKILNTFAWMLVEWLVQSQNELEGEINEPGDEYIDGEIMNKIDDLPTNIILYGPPGTGKTYHAISKAVAIIDPEFYENNKANRMALVSRYQELKKGGRVSFVTFHQSFSYEDFIEGLKAEVINGQIRYVVEDGIFKRMCDEEQVELAEDSSSNIDISGKTIWKMSLGNTLGDDSYIYDHCIEASEIRLGYGRLIDFSDCNTREEVFNKFKANNRDLDENDYNITSVNTFKNSMAPGDIVIVSDGNTKFRAIAEIVGEYECLPSDELEDYAQTRKVRWHRVYDKSIPYERIMNNKFSQMTLYRLSPKAINHEKLGSLLGVEPVGKNNVLLKGQKLGDSNYTIVDCNEEIVRIKSHKTDSVIPIDMMIINELIGHIKKGVITIDDINKKRVFEKVDSKLEKFIVNGYPGIISNLVVMLLSRDSNNTTGTIRPNLKRVLIIDEINRGNISSIFGELITLIEPSKRAGANEELSVTLPYSKTEFRVPQNLYLIGTMNTADRSLALMDTALRRRFDFEEMMPEPEILNGLVIKGINVQKLLETMNERIQVLYDREHTLGHAFFMRIKDIENEDDQFKELQAVFSNKILPLLEEYFFEDWEKIRLVLADNQKPEENQFIQINNAYTPEKLFGDMDNYRLLDEKTNVYLRHNADLSPIAYQQIYAP